jgi:hypothetical protein
VEYRSIPWSNHGRGRHHLTVRLALFYLSWMTGVGQNALQPSYPSFDSFWFRLDGNCVHNTTGLLSKKPAKSLEYPNPSGERGPRWVTFGSEEENESLDVLTLESVLTLDVTKAEGTYYYYYYSGEADQVVLITQDTPVYDVTGEQYGFFDGLSWRTGSLADPSKARGKPRKKHRK